MSKAPAEGQKPTNSRRRWLMIGAILVVCLVLGMGLYYFFTPSSFYEKAAHKLKGKSESEVDAMLGKPYEFEYTGDSSNARLQFSYYHLDGAASPLILGFYEGAVVTWCTGPVRDRVCHPVE